MRKFFKILLIGISVAAILVLVIGLFIFNKLPSVKKIATLVSGSKKSELVVKKNNELTVPTAPFEETRSNADRSSSQQQVSNGTEKPVEAKGIINEKILDNLMATDQPLSDFCGSLKQGKTGAFTGEEFNKAFSASFESSHPDLRVQATKPLLRYVFRLPRMQKLINDLEEAADRDNENFADKAQFYGAAYGAFTDMKSHQADMESIMDRSYLFLGLNNLIAKYPSLAIDNRVTNFCNSTETLFNESTPVDFPTEKNNFLHLLQDAGVNPKDISFDPNYKSSIVFDFDGKSLTFTGGWLDEMIKPDDATK